MKTFRQLVEAIKAVEKPTHLEITPHQYTAGTHSGTAIEARGNHSVYGEHGAGGVDANIRKNLSSPEHNEAYKAANAYSSKHLGKPYDLHQDHPQSSLRKQYAIGKAYDLATQKSPEYKSAVFDDYKKNRPDIVHATSSHDYDSLVKGSYHAVAHETQKQFESLPVKTQYHHGDMNYHNSTELLRDVHAHKNLTVFRGGDRHEFLHNTDSKTGLNENEKFRAVHDYYGHAVHGNQFGPKGEEVAWNSHHKMFSPAAHVAMTSETRGQNSNVNYTTRNLGVHKEMEHHRMQQRQALNAGNTHEANQHATKVREAGDKTRYAEQASVALPSAMLSPHYSGETPESIKHLMHDPEAKHNPEYNVHEDKHGLVDLARHHNTTSHSSVSGGKFNAENAHEDLKHIAGVHGYTKLSHNPYI